MSEIDIYNGHTHEHCIRIIILTSSMQTLRRTGMQTKKIVTPISIFYFEEDMLSIIFTKGHLWVM